MPGEHRRGPAHHGSGHVGHEHGSRSKVTKNRHSSNVVSSNVTTNTSKQKETKKPDALSTEETVTINNNASSETNTNDNNNMSEQQVQNEAQDNIENNNVEVPDTTNVAPEPEPMAEKETPETPEPEEKSFQAQILEYSEIFESDKFRNIDEDYPVDDLIHIVNSISRTIEDFKSHSLSSQQQLESLRYQMKQVKDNIHTSISKNAIKYAEDDEIQTIEESKLTEKLQRLNAEVARANADLSEALRLSAETERSAVTAQLAAERAKEEAKRIEEEIELKAKVEAKRKIEEERRMEEERKQKEEELRQEALARKAKEAEWKRKELSQPEKAPVWENWPTCEFSINSPSHDLDVGCVVRGEPSSFSQSDLSLQVVDQQESDLTYNNNEELISCLLRFEPNTEDNKLQEPVFVAVPFLLSRSATQAREPFIKAKQSGGNWQEVTSQEVSFDNHRDVKFLQTAISYDTTLAVMTRFKQDYVTLTRRPGRVVSSYDHRVTMTVDKDTFSKKELFRLQVQPVDSASVHELQMKKPECRGLLTCSPIISTEWESKTLTQPVTFTIPCPPNPAKARKLAQIRKLKEEKMKTPIRHLPPPPPAVDEKEEKRRKLREQQEQALKGDTEDQKEPTPTKWYMGEYANDDDDESDLLYLVTFNKAGRCVVQTNINIQQVKLDLLEFKLPFPVEKLMVLRTRTNVLEEAVPKMGIAIYNFVNKKFAQVIVKQRSDDPFDVIVTIVPVSKMEKSLKQLSESGFEEGPEPSSIITVHEGDVIEASFRGNITSSNKDQSLRLVFNSNLKSEIRFFAAEVDQYLQKNFSVYRGIIQLNRCTWVKSEDKSKKQTQDEGGVEQEMEIKRELLCEMSLTIPKYHLENGSVPRTAPITIIATSDPVDMDMMRELAHELGDEWRSMASVLNVSRARLQAITSHIQYGDRSEEEAKYDMLMSWLKKLPKAVDKVATLSSALLRCGRGDLADDILKKGRDFRFGNSDSR